MKDRQRSLFGAALTAFALCLALLPAVAASAYVPISEINVDTTLTADHPGGIAFKADNVTLDCGGYSIIEDHVSDEGVGILMEGLTGLTVKNCRVIGFMHGVHLSQVSESVVKNTTIEAPAESYPTSSEDSNEVYGFYIGQGGFPSHHNVFEGNTVSGAEHGFWITGSHHNTFDGNTATGNSGVGMVLFSADSNIIKNNTASGNLRGGFFTDGIGNTFTGNGAHSNGDVGIDDDAAVGASAYSKNYCTGNKNGGSAPSGLCQEEQVGLVNTASGEWHLRHSENDITTFYYGNPGDVPFMGDWDCDTVATPGLFRTSDAFAYLRNSSTQGIADIRFFFGNPSDIPLAGDFNGDGCDTLSIYRPSEARFYIMNKLGENEGGLGAADYSFLFGNPGDKPVVGDWDGDGVDEIGLHRETTGFFYYRNTLSTGIADGQFFFGDPGDRFVAGDWGVVDGVETPAMYRPSNMTFYFRHTLTQGNADSQFVWTGAGMGWVPIAGGFAD
jgi:parallel beta-helix repeat protein